MALPLVLFLLAHFLTDVHGYTINVADSRITCWTCPNKGSNLECNDWAPDRFCPLDHSVCQTVHGFSEVTGHSVRVDKRCVLPENCTRQTIGCRTDQRTRTTTCVSCCTKSYCNQEVAHDNNTAIRLSVTVIESGACNSHFDWTIFVVASVMLLLLF